MSRAGKHTEREYLCFRGCGKTVIGKNSRKSCFDCHAKAVGKSHAKAVAKRKQDPEKVARDRRSFLKWQQSEKGKAYYNNPLYKAQQKSERIRKAYGLDPEQYVQLLAKYNNECALPQCNNTEDLVIDHDHDCCPGSSTCGVCIRGVLCRQCNAAIGKLGDNKKAILNVLAYLTQ